MNRLTKYLSLISTVILALPSSPPPSLFSSNVTFPLNITDTAALRSAPPDPWYFNASPMYLRCSRYGYLLPLSPVINIIQQAHLAASMEDQNKPLPESGLTYTGLVLEPPGRLLFSIMNDPIITYGQWEVTLLALRIFVETWETVEFWFEVAMDTGIGQGIHSLAMGRLVDVTHPPMPRPLSESEK